jgi:hypothetical protein
MQGLDIALAIGLTGFSIIVLATSFYSYTKTKINKLLPICLAFLLFLIKGLYFIWEVNAAGTLSTPLRLVLVLDFFIIILIYIAIAKR